MRAPLVWTALLLTSLVRAQEPDKKPKAPDPNRWEKTIAAFEDRDRTSPPPRGAILFTGSSSITRWKGLEKYFPGLELINRGFGGSTTPDVNRYVDRIVLPYEPKTVVLYSGSNDIAGKHTPEQVLEEFRKFVKSIHARLPQTRILYVSIHLPPGRLKLKAEYDRANELLKAECDTDSRLAFVDLRDTMLGPDGQPDPTLYADPLHPTEEAYERWARRLRPYLDAK